MNRLISPDPRRKESLWHARWVTTLYQAAKPDPASAAFSARVSTLVLIANTIRERLGEGPADISGVMAAVISQECDLCVPFPYSRQYVHAIWKHYSVMRSNGARALLHRGLSHDWTQSPRDSDILSPASTCGAARVGVWRAR